MRAAVRYRYGSAGVVEFADVPEPMLEADQVIVQVEAAGLDRGVLHLVEGTPYALRLVFGLGKPRRPTLGLDLAGTVVSVGAEVSAWQVGDEVMGIGVGSFAQRCAAVPGKLVRRPMALDAVGAASLPISGLTALQAVEAAVVIPGDRVLVLGASGGVGVYAVQIAVAAGAQVTAACSPGKAALIAELGAQEVVSYELPLPDGFDVVLAIGGNAPVRQMRGLLKPRGRLVVIGGEGGGQVLGIGRQIRAVALNPFVQQRLGMLVSRESGEDLQRLVDMVERGSVRPVVGATYGLGDVGRALADLSAGKIAGKAVIEVAG